MDPRPSITINSFHPKIWVHKNHRVRLHGSWCWRSFTIHNLSK